MGKSKNQNHCMKKNIFKVAGCKSLVTKNKAKSVTADRIKKLNLKNKQHIKNIDEQFVTLNKEVRKPPAESKANSIRTSTSCNRGIAERIEIIRKYNETSENCTQALDKLCSMEM